MIYKLKDKKEKENYDQKVSSNNVYTYSVDFSEKLDLEEQEKYARKVFFPYLRKEKFPKRGVSEGFYFETENLIAFQGKGEHSSLFFDMLVLPKLKHGYNKENDKIVLKSCKDLTEKHKFLLDEIKIETYKFVKRNRIWFYRVYNFKNIEYWLNNIQFGFHYPPTVGYLHAHVLIGPLTEHGFNLSDRWVKMENFF